MKYYQTPDGQHYAVAGDDLDFAIGQDFLIDGDEEDEGFAEDYFGADYMIGDDDDLDPIFGAENAMAKVVGGQKQMARLRNMALAKMAGGFAARRKPVVRQGYKLTLPFSQSFAAGATGTITLSPQRSFRLSQLVVGNSTAALFQLNSLNVGQDNQFIASGAMNMEVFSNLSAQKVQLAGSTANLGTTIVLNVTNLDVAVRVLSGMLMGPTILQVA